MNKIYKTSLVCLLGLGLTACADFLEPLQDNGLNTDQVFQNAYYFTGPLMAAYDAIPKAFDANMDLLTDNAVYRANNNSYVLGGTGSMSPASNVLDDYTNSYAQIRRVNQFLQQMVFTPGAVLPTPVRFFPIHSAQDSLDNVAYFFRLKGEAYFVRAYWEHNLLKRYGALGVNNQLLGVPMVGDKVLDGNDNANIARSTYEECLRQVVADCDSAIKYLPVQYTGTGNIDGAQFNDRASGIAAMALKARALLYAASPLFNPEGSQAKWEAAALAAAEVIKQAGGLNALSPIDDYYFTKLNNGTFENKDILFRSTIQTNRSMEDANYPMGIEGSSNINPSQNFVDAFPDKNGYPIGMAESLYNPQDPYINRDPRLALYVGYNNSTIGPTKYKIKSYVGGDDEYQPGKNTSRTNYYLKKLLRYNSVNTLTGSKTNTTRAHIVLGMPEMYLSYAEAANEAWGVKADPRGLGFTAYDALRMIQQRYGCSANYLNNVIGTDVSLFRDYIRNERRLELSFEGHYYLDLRRWLTTPDVSQVNVPVYGVEIRLQEDGSFHYSRKLVENRYFTSIFLPFSYSELAAAKALVQNYGWDSVN